MELEESFPVNQELRQFLGSFEPLKCCLDLPKIHGFSRSCTSCGDGDGECELCEGRRSGRNVLAANPLLEGASPLLQFPLELTGDSTAVVTFTSGSTGRPKGVMGRHSSLTHFYPWMEKTFDLRPTDRYSMCSGIAHDPLQRDIFTPVFFGCTLYIPTQDDIVTPGRLAEWMNANDVNIACLTPAMGQLLNTAAEGVTIPTLRVCLFVGDLLIKRDVRRLTHIAPNVSVINMYGSTETQRAVGYYAVPREPELLDRMKEVMPAGKGMFDSQLLILNKRGRLSAVGEAGEIYVRSPHIAKGYIGLPDQTRAKFLTNPFLPSETTCIEDRVYRTGDLGRYMLDGNVEVMGRADEQVKIRGFRIELGEINAKLSTLPGVRENVTIVRTDGDREKRIVSYVVPVDGSSADSPSVEMEQSLIGLLRKKLPAYMVPSRIVILEMLPLTPNGKIDRAVLPPPKERGSSTAASVDNTRILHSLTETERTVARLFASILNISVQSRDDDFFHLGGHSLLATRFIQALQDEEGLTLPASAIYQCPTIATLSQRVDSLRNASGPGDASSSGPAEDPSVVDQLLADSELPPDIRPKCPVTSVGPNQGEPERFSKVFLTGGTGFLGAHLLQALLSRDKVEVVCLARAKDHRHAAERISRSMVQHGLWEHAELVEAAEECGTNCVGYVSSNSRVRCVAGDLGQARFGLDDATWTVLCAWTEVIINNGAYVHWYWLLLLCVSHLSFSTFLSGCTLTPH